MLLFVYTTTRKRFVIFTCRCFKVSRNTTTLSQSNCRNLLCSRKMPAIYHREEKCVVTLPWQHYFQMTTKPTATAGRTAKYNMFVLTNNNFACAARYFVHFFAVVAHYNMKLPNFTSPLYGVDEPKQKLSLSFF